MKTGRIIVLFISTFAAGIGLGRYSASVSERSASAVGAASELPAEHPSTLSAKAMGDSVREALRDQDTLDRLSALGRLLQGLHVKNLSGALEAYEENLGSAGEAEVRLFAHAWARFDAPAAFERFLGWSRPKAKIAAPAALYGWAVLDPWAAKRAADSIQDSGDRTFSDKCLGSVVRGWVLSGQPGLAEYLASLPNGTARLYLTSLMVAQSINKDGPEAVMHWVESLPEDSNHNFKQTVFERAANGISLRNPAQAGAWVEAHANRNYSQGAMLLVARNWVRVDGSAALGWLERQPPGEARNAAVSAAFARWLKFDREAAENWIRKTTLSHALDPAVGVYARTLAAVSPPEAIAWAERIRDEDLRVRSLTNIGRIWLRRDPGAARTWLAQSELPEAARQAALAAPEGMRAGQRHPLTPEPSPPGAP